MFQIVRLVNSFLYVPDRGELINWGRNNYGQLSSDGTERTVPWNPLLIKNVQRTKQVAVGSEHNILLTGKI